MHSTVFPDTTAEADTEQQTVKFLRINYSFTNQNIIATVGINAQRVVQIHRIKPSLTDGRQCIGAPSSHIQYGGFKFKIGAQWIGRIGRHAARDVEGTAPDKGNAIGQNSIAINGLVNIVRQKVFIIGRKDTINKLSGRQVGTQIFMRVVVLAPDAMAIGICGNSGNQTQKTIDLFVSGVDIFVD